MTSDDPIPDPDADEEEESNGWRESLPNVRERIPSVNVRDTADSATSGGSYALESARKFAKLAWPKVRSPLIHLIALIATLVVVWQVLGWLWGSIGPIMTIAAVVFTILGATMIPLGTLLFGPSFPGFARNMFGKMHWFLGELAFGSTYLVETDDGWTLCPGDAEKYWLDGEWEDIEGGHEHRSVIFGFSFGVLRHKTDESYKDVRADGDAGSGTPATATDGGATRNRAGIDQIDAGESDGDHFLVDLVRVGTDGLLEAGDARLIEEAEYDQLEEIAGGTRLDGWKPLLAMLAGIFFGAFFALMQTGAIM